MKKLYTYKCQTRVAKITIELTAKNVTEAYAMYKNFADKIEADFIEVECQRIK